MFEIIGSNFSDYLPGTNFDDDMYGFDGDDLIEGFAGNDFVNGGAGFDTMDYSRAGRAVTLLPGGRISKGNLGTDQVIGVERVVGARGFANLIDGASGSGQASFEIDLGANSLVVNDVPFLGTISFTVENFVNVRGTPSDDTIAGNRAANFLDGWSGDDFLIGRGGNDTLVGNAGVDVLIGTDSSARGFREVDRLTGGLNGDGFVLGDRSGSYYRAGGFADYAIITDFSSNDIIQLGAREVYQARRDATGFDLFVLRNGVFDLIADVRTTSSIRLPSGNFRLASNQTFGNFLGA
jgi:Ca2+-binding RTX toxin-like protein